MRKRNGLSTFYVSPRNVKWVLLKALSYWQQSVQMAIPAHPTCARVHVHVSGMYAHLHYWLNLQMGKETAMPAVLGRIHPEAYRTGLLPWKEEFSGSTAAGAGHYF